MFKFRDAYRSERCVRMALTSAIVATVFVSVLASAHGQVPTVLFGGTTFLPSATVSGSINGSPYNGSTGHMAANSRGDLFYPDSPYSYTSTSGFLAELPYNGSTTVAILVNMGGGSLGATVDANSNIYAVDSQGFIDYVPFVNNGYATGTDASTLTNCALPISSATSPCRLPVDNSQVGGYYQPGDVQVDSSGNLYVYDQNVKRVMEALIPTGSAANYVLETVVVPAVAPASGTHTTIAVDSQGNLVYADGNAVTAYTASSIASAYASSVTANSTNPAGTATYATGASIGSGLSQPGGASLDTTGNLYIADTGNDRIVIIPLVGGVRTTANQYTAVANPTNTTASTGPAIDGYGTIYYAGSGQNTINSASLGSVSLGPYGNYYYAPNTTATLSFAKAATISSFTITGPSAAAFSITQQGCNLNTQYAAGATCTVQVTFTTQTTGIPLAAINALDSGGNVLGSASLSGLTNTPGLNIDPGTVTAIGAAWAAPSSVAIGPGGRVFVADSSTGKVYTSTNGAAQTVLASGFSSPSAILVDSEGNLYVADTGNHQLVELPYVNSAYGSKVVLATGLSGPSGLAISQTGTLFLADSGNARVIILARSGGGALGSLMGTIGSGFTQPVGVAVDNQGSLFVADAGSKQLIQIDLTTHTQSAILNGSQLAGVAAASDGSVYVVDQGSKTLTRIPQVNGELVPGSAVVLASPVATPYAITTDLYNNLYVADKSAGAVAEVNRSIGALNFGNVTPGSSSGALVATVTNSGNSNPNSGVTPNPSNTTLSFYYIGSPSTPFVAQSTYTCPTTFPQNGPTPTLTAGASCTISAVYTPTDASSSQQTITFSSSAPGTQSLLLNGSGHSLTGPASLVYGATTTSIYTLYATPDGNYSVSITGTATSTVPVTVSGGSGTFTLPALGAGSYVLSSTDSSGNVASESITVTPAVLTVSVSGTYTRIYGQPNPAFAYSITGFVGSDTAASATTGTPSLTTNAVPKSPAGPYTITVGEGTLAATNYTFTTTNGTLTVNGGAVQAILFPSLANFTHGTSVPLAALSTSGLPITYGVTNGPASISGSTLTITGMGSVTITASQAGNGNFGAATPVSRTFTAQ